MPLDTNNTIYVCTDGENGEVKILLPRGCKMEVQELKLDERDPNSARGNDKHEYHLLKEEMDEHTFEI